MKTLSLNQLRNNRKLNSRKITQGEIFLKWWFMCFTPFSGNKCNSQNLEIIAFLLWKKCHWNKTSILNERWLWSKRPSPNNTGKSLRHISEYTFETLLILHINSHACGSWQFSSGCHHLHYGELFSSLDLCSAISELKFELQKVLSRVDSSLTKRLLITPLTHTQTHIHLPALTIHDLCIIWITLVKTFIILLIYNAAVRSAAGE